MSSLKTTVTELLHTFRDALAAIAPVVERVRIKWKEPDVYDDWDAIAEVLFQQIVVESLRWSLPDAHQVHFSLPQYAMKQASFADTSYIGVVEGKAERRLAFHSFVTRDSPFDTVRTQQITEGGNVFEESVFFDVGLASAQFVLYRRGAEGTTKVDRVTVML